jgi:hypothetical protein
MKSKKTIYELREQMLDAQNQFRMLRFEDDHIVCMFAYNSKFESHLTQKKERLKSYIMCEFENILNVDIFADYFVVWHSFTHIDPQQTPYNTSILYQDENDK